MMTNQRCLILLSNLLSFYQAMFFKGQMLRIISNQEFVQVYILR
jgi:hypothetical protein